MEKEREGLFGRMVQFWKEKVHPDGADRIGFWKEKKATETPFSEMGAVAALSQRETKETFWEETAKKETKMQTALGEEREQKEQRQEEKSEKRKAAGLFTAEVFREGKTEAESRLGQRFFRENPEEETERRKHIPVEKERMQTAKEERETQTETKMQKEPKKAEKRAEPVVDLEELMRQMTKRLWEEREGCGRRLR